MLDIVQMYKLSRKVSSRNSRNPTGWTIARMYVQLIFMHIQLTLKLDVTWFIYSKRLIHTWNIGNFAWKLFEITVIKSKSLEKLATISHKNAKNIFVICFPLKRKFVLVVIFHTLKIREDLINICSPSSSMFQKQLRNQTAGHSRTKCEFLSPCQRFAMRWQTVRWNSWILPIYTVQFVKRSLIFFFLTHPVVLEILLVKSVII